MSDDYERIHELLSEIVPGNQRGSDDMVATCGLVVGWVAVVEWQGDDGLRYLSAIRGPQPESVQPSIYTVRGWLWSLLHDPALFDTDDDEQA